MTMDKFSTMMFAAVLLFTSQPTLAQDKEKHASEVDKRWIIRGADDGVVRITLADGSVMEGRKIRFRLPTVVSDSGEHWFVAVNEPGGRVIVASDNPEDRESVPGTRVSAKVIVLDTKTREFGVAR